MTLGEYLLFCGTKRRQAAVYDCCTFPADWAMACGHRDPMAKWRGTYDTEADAEHLIAEALARGEGLGHGGLEHLFLEGMWSAAIPEIDGSRNSGGANPPPLLPGDIGVIEIVGEEAGAIYTGERWALAGERGIVCASVPRRLVARVWRP